MGYHAYLRPEILYLQVDSGSMKGDITVHAFRYKVHVKNRKILWDRSRWDGLYIGMGGG